MRFGALPALALAVAACNAVTGASSLEAVEDLAGDPAGDDGGALLGGEGDGGGTSSSGDSGAAGPDAAGDPDGGAGDAAAGDADAASVPDAGPCTPVSVGPRYGTVSSGDWMNPDGILAPNNIPAHSIGLGTPIVASDFGFSLPQGAVIKGIKVDIARTTIGSVADKAIALPKGTSKANGAWPAGNIGGPYQTATYGGATDLWGATWTAADINAATFGVSLSVMGNGDGHADSIGVTVTYCP